MFSLQIPMKPRTHHFRFRDQFQAGNFETSRSKTTPDARNPIINRFWSTLTDLGWFWYGWYPGYLCGMVRDWSGIYLEAILYLGSIPQRPCLIKKCTFRPMVYTVLIYIHICTHMKTHSRCPCHSCTNRPRSCMTLRYRRIVGLMQTAWQAQIPWIVVRHPLV